MWRPSSGGFAPRTWGARTTNGHSSRYGSSWLSRSRPPTGCPCCNAARVTPRVAGATERHARRVRVAVRFARVGHAGAGGWPEAEKGAGMGDAPERVVFRVLGPLDVLVDGHALALGGTRQRLVLAALLAQANTVVSSDRLIDIVWADEPPATALSTLQKYVHRLRASLGDRLMTRAPGYVLRMEGEESDASRFESLLADATRQTTAGELSDAIATFDAA